MKTSVNILVLFVFAVLLFGCETLPKDGKSALDAYAKGPMTATITSYDGGPKNGNFLAEFEIKF